MEPSASPVTPTCSDPTHAHLGSSCEVRDALPENKPWTPTPRDPFARLRGLRVLVRDWFWLRRVAAAQVDPNESIADYIVRTKSEENDARARLGEVWEAHEWGCDCTPDDPCRILIALNGGRGRK